MADGSPKTPAPSAVAAQARAGAPAAQGDMDRICLPCAGLIRVEACYRDTWNTPLTNACVRVEDSTGVVVDGAVRTEPLIAHGLKDGDAPTAPLTTMGTTPPIEVAQGTSEVTLVPQGAGEADAGMGDLGAALAGFRDDALVKLQPYVLEWEARGLLSIPEARFRGVGKGLSAWYQGEADFWGGVSDRAVAAYQNAQNWHDAYVARQSPFEQGMMQYGGPFGAIAVYGTSLVETAAETVSDWISGADDLAAYIATIMAAMRDLASGTVDLMEAALDSLRALPGDAGRLFSQLIDNGQDWIERLVLIASETNAFEYVFHVFMAVAMNMTPNFWAEMAGVVSGFILPEVLIEIILAVIAALTGGGGIALLAGRLATFVAKLRGLAVKAKSLGVLASIVEAFGKAISALAKIGKGLHDEIEAFTRAGANGVARIRHRVNQYKVEIDPNTLGMNGGNIRITRKRAQIHPDIGEHMRKRDHTVPRKRGIGGAHEKIEFERELASEGGIVTNRAPHPTLKGVEQIEYQLPALDAKGNPTGAMRTKTFQKTIYDTNHLPERDLLNMGQEAADNALARSGGTLPHEWVGQTSDGITMRGYSTDGVVTSFFPDISP